MKGGKEGRRVFRFLRFQLFRFLRFSLAAYILQSNYEKCLNFGLKARAIPTQTIDGKQPVLVIQMLNVGRCPTCGSWIVGWTCPTC